MPAVADPSLWWQAVAGLSRGAALIVLVSAASMLVLGLRGFRYYVSLAAGLLGYAVGAVLGDLMHVRQVYVALPAALTSAALAWPIARRLMPLVFSAGAACVGGLVVVRVLGVRGDGYWLGFLAGGLFGLGLWLLAARFSTALLYAAGGSFLCLASIGAVVRADAGPLAVGAVSRYPLGFTLAGILLFLVAVVMQVVFDDYDAPELSGVSG